MALVQLIPGRNRHMVHYSLPRGGARSVIYAEVRAEKPIRLKVWCGIDAFRQETACEGRPSEMWSDIRGTSFDASIGPANGFEGGRVMLEVVALEPEGEPFALHLESFARTVHGCD